MNAHKLYKRLTKNPLGTRVQIRCLPCRDYMPKFGDWTDANTWIQSHAGVGKSDADQMIRAAGRWEG